MHLPLVIKYTTMKHEQNKNIPDPTLNKEEKKTPGYPPYPADQDIYFNAKKEASIKPDDISKTKTPNESTGIGSRNEKDFNDDLSGGDLDVPGSELDDEEEKIGSEDEENNSYSIGGDMHNDLEENQGD